MRNVFTTLPSPQKNSRSFNDNTILLLVSYKRVFQQDNWFFLYYRGNGNSPLELNIPQINQAENMKGRFHAQLRIIH